MVCAGGMCCAVDQCSSADAGLQVNALIPAHHYLHTPGGPLQYSLEGHRFAPFGVAATSDGQYVVTASTVFIIWDVATGDVFRQVGLATRGGLVRHLVLTPDDQTAVAITSNNEVRPSHNAATVHAELCSTAACAANI